MEKDITMTNNLILAENDISVISTNDEEILIEASLKNPIIIKDIPSDSFRFKLTGRFGISGTGSIHGLSCENGMVDFLVIKIENSNFSDICGKIK